MVMPTVIVLTHKQRLFVNEYLKCWNATQAAIRAGYKERSAHSIGSENLQKEAVRAEIDSRIAELELETGASLREIKRIAAQQRKESKKSPRRTRYTEKHLCNLIEANVQQVSVALNLSPVVEAIREYQMPAMRADFVFRHIDGTHTLVEVKTGNAKQGIVRQMHGALGQGVFYTAAYSAIEQVDVSKVRLCLLVDFDIDEDAFLENTLTTALERIDMPITVVNVIRLLGLTDGAQQPLL